MRHLLFTVLALAAPPALAKEHACSTEPGMAGILRLVGWAARPAGDDTVLALTYRNVSGRMLAMAEARIWFHHADGGPIGSVAIDPDTNLPPDAEKTEIVRAPGLEALYRTDRASLTGFACVAIADFGRGVRERLD